MNKKRHSLWTRLRVALATASILFVTSTQAQLSDGEREDVASEIRSALENYHRIFSGKQPDEIAEHAYGAPLVSFGAQGNPTVWNTTQEVETWVAGFMTQLQQQGWHRSDMPSPTICVLGESSGFASGFYVRYREDGSIISRTGIAYIFGKTGDAWKVVAFLPHEIAHPLSCDN